MEFFSGESLKKSTKSFSAGLKVVTLAASISASRLLAGEYTDYERQVDSVKYALKWSYADYALEQSKLFAEQHPKLAISHTFLAQAYMKNGQLDLALKEAEIAMKMAKDDFEAQFLYAEYLHANQKYTEVIRFSQTLTSRFDLPGKMFDLLGRAYQNIGKYSEAVVCYEKAIALGENGGNLQTNLLEAKRGQYEQLYAVKSRDDISVTEKSSKTTQKKQKPKKHS